MSTGEADRPWTRFILPLIVLTPDQAKRAMEVCVKRQQLALKYGRKHGNAGNVSDEEQLRGCRCELAAKTYLEPIKWNDVSEAQYLGHDPDLEAGRLKIDVKSIGRSYHQLAAYRIVPEWVYLLVEEDEREQFWLHGWLWGRELLRQHIKELRPGRPAHVAPQSELHDPAKLRSTTNADRD